MVVGSGEVRYGKLPTFQVTARESVSVPEATTKLEYSSKVVTR